MSHPRPLLRSLFGLFLQTIGTIFWEQINVKQIHLVNGGIQTHDILIISLIPWSLDWEFHPLNNWAFLSLISFIWNQIRTRNQTNEVDSSDHGAPSSSTLPKHVFTTEKSRPKMFFQKYIFASSRVEVIFEMGGACPALPRSLTHDILLQMITIFPVPAFTHKNSFFLSLSLLISLTLSPWSSLVKGGTTCFR